MAKLFDINSIRQNISGSTPEPASVPTPAPAPPKLTIPKNTQEQTSAPTTPSAPKFTIPKNNGMSVDRSKVSITPEELTSRLKGANIQTPFKSPEQKAESAKPVNPFRPYVNPDTKASMRENPAFQRNTASWLNIEGTTGTSRNRSAGKMYDWVDYTDENGNQVSGMWSWWDDNGKRFNAVSSFAQDGQWHDRSSMRGYMQEAANLYYDYDEMADYMTGIIRDMENTIKTTKYETEAAKKADEAYLASMRTNLEGAKALRDSSRKLYDYMSTQNEYMDAYDDYHVKDASDSKNYSETYNSAEYGEIPGGRTPEDWDSVIESLNEELDKLPKDSPNGMLTRPIEDIKRQLVIAEYARDKAAEEKAQIEKDNLGLKLGRDYYNVHDSKGWKSIEADLQTQLDAIPETETEERKSVQDRLDYVHDFVKAGEYKDFYDKWKDVSDDELIRRIMELGADPEKTEEVIKPVETNSGSVDAQIEELQSKLYKLDSTSQEYLDTAKQLKELRATSEAEKAKAEEEKAKAETPAEKTPAELRAEKEEAERRQLELDAISYIRDIRLMTGSSKAFEDYKKANPDATAADWVESVKANADEKEALLVKAEDAAADAEEDMHKLRSRLDEAIRVAMAEGREVTLDDIKTDDLNLHGVEIDITDLDKTEQELDALLNKDIEAARMALSYARQQKAWADAYSEFDMTQQPDYKDKVKEGWKIMGSAEDLKNLLQDVRDLVTTGGMDTYEVVYPNLWSLKDKNDQITDDDINEIIDTYEASEFSPQMAEKAKDLIRTLDPTVTDEEIESMLDRDAATITNDDRAIKLLTDYGFSKEDAESMVRKLKVGGNDEKILDALTPFVVDDGKMSFSEMMESVWKPTAANGIEKGEFSPEQLSNYYYILATEGLSAATDYALKVNNQLTSGYRDEVRKKMALLNDYRADHSTGFEKGLQYVATPWVTGIMNLTGIADFFIARNQVKYLGNSILSEAPSISEAADWITQDTNRQLTRDGASQLVLFFNNAYGSAVQSYEAMALGGALAKFLGIGESTVLNLGLNKGRNVHEFITTVFTDAAFFGSAASSRYRELIDRGVDPEKAMDNAIVTGICEAAFEHISIDKLYHAKDVADFTGIGDVIMSTIIGSGIEGSEEMCTELANYVFDRFMLGMEGDFFQSVEAYRNQGMTEADAFAKAKKDLAFKIGEAGAAGFVSGGMSIGPRTGMYYAQERFSVKDYERARGKTFLDHQYADGKNGGQALGEFLLKYDFFHENQDENSDPTALPGKGRGDYSDTQHDVFNTIKNLADKASRGIASAEDIGRLVSLADSLDPKIMDDFMLANKDYAWQSDPARAIRVAENDLVAFLGVDKANAYIEAVGKNPDAFVVDDFYKGMLESGTTLTKEEIVSTETFLQQVFTGNGQLSAEAIAEEIKNNTDPKAQLYILEFLRANQKQGTAQAEAQTEDAGNTYGLVVDESVNLEADNTPERVTNALIKGLTATWERAARAASDFRIMNQSFAKLQEMAQETLKQDARTEGTAAFAESESDETTPALSDFRDDGDSVTFRGKKFNRKEYVASVMEGKDPFSGETVENTTEEWANKSFDALLERASDESFGKSDEMSAEMVNFDLAKHTPKEKATATTATATAETNADKAAGGELKKTTSKTKPKNIPAKKNTPKGKNKAEVKADKAAGGESKKTTPKKTEPKNIPAKKNLPKGKNKAEVKADTAAGSTEETTTPVETAPKTDEATELTGEELALAQKEDLDRIEREFRDEMGETSEEVPTVEELRDQEIESETDEGETSFGTTEGSTTRTWDDTFQLDGESITRADFVHSYMSGTDPLTGEDTYPLTQAQANAAFDRTYAYAMQQGGSIEGDGSYSTDADVKTGVVSDVRQLALENELNALESILKNKKEAGDTIGRGLIQKIDYARKRIQDALGRQITRLGSDVESRRKELNDQLKAIDSRMNQIRQYIKNKAVGSLIFNKELDGLKAKRRDVKAKLTSLNNAVAAYNTAVDKLEDWRNRMYATDYYTILGGLTYDGRSSTDRNTERTGDVGDAGSSRTDVNTSADRTGTTEGAGGQTQRRTARSVEQVLSEAGLKLKGTVALDTAMVTARDIYNDKSLPRSVKTAILHALRNGVSRVIITDGTLQNESGQNIGGYTHLTKENGIDRSIFILNKQSKIPMQQNILHEYVHHMLGRLAPQNRASFLRNAMNVLFRGRQDLFEAVYNTYLDDYVKAYNLTLDADGKLSPEQALDIYEEIVADMYGMIPRFTAAQDEKLNAAMNPFLFDMRGRLLRYMELSGLEDYSREKWIGEDHQGLTHYDVEDFVGTRSAMGGTVEGKAVSPEVAAETGMLVDELTIPDSADGQPEIMNVSGNKKLSGKASIAPEYKATPKQSTKVNNSSVTKKTLTDKKGNLVNRTVREVRDEAFRKNREFMTEQGEAGIRKFNSFLDKVADWLTNTAAQKFRYLNFEDINNATLKVDPVSNQLILTSMVKNGDYAVNIDFGTICERRQALQTIMNELLEGASYDENGIKTVQLNAKSIHKINEALRDAGINTQCLICFVETKRYNQTKQFAEFTELWNNEVKKYTDSNEFFKFRKGAKELTEEHIEARRKALDGYSGYGKGVNTEKAVADMVKRLAKYSPEDLKLLDINDIASSKGRTSISQFFPDLDGLIKKKGGSAAPKPVYGYIPYNGEIEGMYKQKRKGETDEQADQRLRDYIKSIAGVRSQSFSDFIITHVFDHLQKTGAMAAKGFVAHTYTKVLARAELFGLTGEKINMSLLFDINPNVNSWYAGLSEETQDIDFSENSGRLGVENARNRPYNFTDYQARMEGKTEWVQSFPYKDAVRIQNTPGFSKNTGTIGVSHSYWHTMWMLADPEIRQVIGYHSSSYPGEIKNITHLNMSTDYTDVQNNVKIVGIARPNYEIPDGTPSYATEPSNAKKLSGEAKRIALAEDEVRKIFGKYANGASVDLSKMLKDAVADKNNRGKSKGQIASEVMQNFLNTLNDSGLTLITTKAEAGHGSFKLYDDVEQTQNPYETMDNYIAYNLSKGNLPAFYEFSTDPNYYKLIFDFNMFDRLSYNPETGLYETYAPQEAVKVLDENGELLFPNKGDIIDALDHYATQYDNEQHHVYDFINDESNMDYVRQVTGVKASVEADIDEVPVIKENTASAIAIPNEKQGAAANAAGQYGVSAKSISDTEQKVNTQNSAHNWASVDEQHNDFAPIFYSRMENVINEWTNGKGQPLPERMSAQQVVGWLKGKGVKDEEIKWSGIVPYLEDKKSVTKQELLDVMAENQVQIETKTLGSVPKFTAIDPITGRNVAFYNSHEANIRAHEIAEEWGLDLVQGYISANRGNFYFKDLDTGEKTEIFQLMDNRYDENGNRKEDFQTHWHDKAYNLSDGENYREILFKLPGLNYSNAASRLHWGDNDAVGTIAHARVDDMNTTDGDRVLFVEEIQSDLHNAGSTSAGFYNRDVEALENIDELQEQRKELRNQYRFYKDRLVNLSNRLLNDFESSYGVSRQVTEDSIFDWLSGHLSSPVKYDIGIGWLFDDYSYEEDIDSPENRAKEKEITEQIDSLLTDEDKKLVEAFKNNSKELDSISKRIETAGKKAPDVPFAGASDTYHEYVMKHLLRQAAENGYDAIGWTTADQQVGRWSDKYAEGYRIEYDQNIPKFMKKYTKQWGGKVEGLNLENGEEVWGVKITPEMRESVLYKGQPKYSIETAVAGGFSAWMNSLKTTPTAEDFRSYFESHPSGINFLREYAVNSVHDKRTGNKSKTAFKKFVNALDPRTMATLSSFNVWKNYVEGSAVNLPWYISDHKDSWYKSCAREFNDILDEAIKSYLDKDKDSGVTDTPLTDQEIEKLRPDLVNAISAIQDRDSNGKLLDWKSFEQTLKSLQWLYKNNPQLNYLTRLANATTANQKKAIRSEFEKMLSGINDRRALWYMSAYSKYATPASVENDRKQVQKEKSAQRLFANTIEARRDAINAEAGLSSNVGMEVREYSIQEIKDMFYQLNTDKDLNALADKVFPVVETLGLTIRGAQAKTTGSTVAGHAYGSVVEYNINQFNGLKNTDQYKATILLHELIHSATSYALYAEEYPGWGIRLSPEMEEATRQLRSVYAQIASDPQLSNMYGAKNVHEMLAELSDPKFREALEKKSLWDRIVDAFKQFFGIDTKNALDAASVGLDYLLDNFDYDSYLKYAQMQNRLHDEFASVYVKAVNTANAARHPGQVQLGHGGSWIARENAVWNEEDNVWEPKEQELVIDDTPTEEKNKGKASVDSNTVLGKNMSVPTEDDIKNGTASYGGLPVKYDPRQTAEARNWTTEITVSDKFFQHDPKTQQHILNHEVAHNISDDIMGKNTGRWAEFSKAFITERDVPDSSEAYARGQRTYWEGLYGDIGATALSETLTRAITEYLDDPDRLRNRSEVAFNEIQNALSDEQSDIPQYSEQVEGKYSIAVEDPETLNFLNEQLENGDVIHAYKSFIEIPNEDGTVNLYAPMDASEKDDDGAYKMTHAMKIGTWEESVGNPNSKKIFYKLDKNGNKVWYYNLTKENGDKVPAAYDPYQHSSNVVLNDQFKSAYKRPRLATYEVVIPASELTSGYHYRKQRADGEIVEAALPVGQHPWHKGDLASHLENTDRQVYLSRWLMPYRKVSDSEVAEMYKDILDREDTNLGVPFNVVPPNLLRELEKINVPIDYMGTGVQEPFYRKALNYVNENREKDGLDPIPYSYLPAEERKKIRLSPKTKGNFSIDSDVPEDVKVIDRKYSLAGPSATSADLGSLSTAIKMELDGAMADDIWEDTGWYRGIDNKWKFEIFDGDIRIRDDQVDKLYQVWLKNDDTIQPFYLLKHLLTGADSLFENYPQLKELPVYVKKLSKDQNYNGVYNSNRKDIILNLNLFDDSVEPEKRNSRATSTLMHEIQHAIQDIEGFSSGSNQDWWGYTRDINGDAVYYTPKNMAQQSIMSYQKALGKEKIDEIYEVAELRDSLINYTAKNRFQTLLDYQTKLHPLVNELGAASVADLLNSIELYSDDFYVDRKKASNWDLYWNTAGEVEARDVQNRMGWSEEKRKAMKPLTPRISTVFTGVDKSGNAKSEGSFSIDSPVDVFGDPVSVDTTEVTNATPSVLSDHVFYADGNAYVQTDDGQTVVINNVTGDSPEAKYINTLETINNADRTATKPYTIPAATRNADDGYNLREQNAGLRRGSEEVSEEYQEESSGRTGSISERNEPGEPQGTEQESVKASLDFSKIPNIEFFNEDGEVVTSSNLYPIGSFQREVLLDIASNNLAGLERTINALWGKNNPPSEEVVSSLRSQIQINNKLTDTEKRNLQNKLNELIPEYGVHPFAHKDPKRADKREDVHLPLRINDDTKTRKFVQTAARNADRKEFSDQALLAALREDISSYEPISDAKARNYAETMLNNQGYNRCLSVIKAKVESNEKLTKYDIALAEMLMKSAELEGNYTDALQLLADIAIIGTNAGQVVQAMSMIKKLTPRGQLYYMQTLVNRLNRTYEKAINDPKNKMNKIIIPDANAQAVLTAKTQEDFEKAVEDLKQAIADQIPATWVDKWNAWRYLAMLGNPRTHVRNLFGNGMFAPAVFVKDLIARELESHTNLVDPEKRSRLAGATFRKDSAYMRFAEENFKVMKDILSGEATDNKYTNLNEIMKLRKIWSDGPIGKFIKGASDLNSKGLETEDLIFLKLYYKRAFAEFLQARGVKEEDLDSTWGTTKETKKVMYEAQAWALREAQRNTYRDANAIATTLNQLKHKNTASYVLLEGLVPFTKTPLNILNRGIEYSPIGLIQSIVTMTRDLRSGQFTTSEAIDRLAAGLTGTFGLTLLGFILAQFGLLRGMGPDDDKEREFDTLQGHQNWSIEVGDVSYTIDWMAPAALPLFVGCSIHDMLQGDFNAFTVWDIGTALSRIAEPLTALSMLDGLNSTLSSIASAQENSSLSTLAGSMLMSYVSQGMPTLAGQFARVFDEDRRATYVDKNSTVPAALQKFIQKSIQAKVPGWENQKMAYVDEWGRTDSSDTVGEIVWKIVENFLSPGYGNKIVSTSVDDELKRLYEATKDNSVLPNKGAKYLTNEGEKKDFTAKEYEEFSKVRGATAFDLLTEIFATSDYQELDDDNKKKIIESVYSYADSIAKQEIVPDMALRSKWMDTAKAIGPADYILIKSDIDDSKTNEKLFAYLASNPRLNESQIATIIAQKYDAPDEVKSVSSNGYIYSLTEEDEEAMSNIFAEVVNERLAELRRDPAYLNADSKEQGRLINDLYAQAREDTKTLYGSMLDGSGRAVELGKASSVGREAFQMVLDVDGGTSEQAGWLSDMYSADKSIKNPLHSGFNLSLDNAQRRELKQEFANAWNTAYKDLVNSAEFKSAPSRAYKNNMIADRYNAVAQQVEEAYAASVYRSGKYTETFGTPSGYTWGEAYSIAKTNLKTPAEQAEWLAQKYSTGSKINNPDRSAFVISLTGAQQAEIKEDFVKEFVPRYTTLVSSSGWGSLSEEQRQARINDLQKKVTSVVEDAYARKLVGRGYYSEELSTDSSYEKYYTMLSTEKLTDTQRKQLLKDKYVGGTISNPEAKEYRIQVYRKFIDDNYGKYVKNGTAAEFEKLHTEASNASGDAVKKKYGIKKLADVPDIEYPSSGAVSLTTGYTPTKPIIPIASTKPKTTTTQQSGLASKYGVIPRK